MRYLDEKNMKDVYYSAGEYTQDLLARMLDNNDGDLIACFNQNISDAVVKEIAKRQPLRAVFRDSGFISSPEKINVEEIFKLFAPNTSVKVL